MADLKITELDANTTPIGADLVAIVDDVAGTAKTEKITLKNLGLVDGWMPASEAWSFASADAPTYTITVPSDATDKYSAGMRIKLTHGAAVKYFIITKVAATVLTVYGGTDYTLSDTAFTLPFYSTQKAPLDFPLSPVKWTVEVTNSDNNSQSSPTQNTWYNTGSISINIPIGIWDVYYQATTVGILASGITSIPVKITLSTANNSESDLELSSLGWMYLTTAELARVYTTHSRRKNLNLATKDTYYLNVMTTIAGLDSIRIKADDNSAIIRAVCAYL